MSGSNVYVGMFCNPTLDQTDPHPAVRYGLPGSRYHRIKISHLSEELFPDPVPADEVFDRGFGEHGDRGVPNWIRDDRWIAQQAHDFGEGSAHFRSYVLGQFADAQAGDRVITGAMLEACSHEQNVPEPVEHLGVGIDLAATEDESVAVLVRGGVVLDLYAWRAAPGDVNPTMSGVDEIQALIPRWEKEHGVRIPHRAIHIDSGGLGRGPAERLVQLGLHVDLVDFGTKPAKGWRDIIGPHVFKNTRAELYWTLRRLLQERLLLIPDRPEFHELRRELLWARWMHVEVGGETAIQLEPKTDIIKRHGRSPDHADALALAMRRPPSPPAFGTYGEKFSTTHLPGPRSSDDGWEPFTGLTT